MEYLAHIQWLDVIVGATGLGIIGHAVNTFPVPKNQYGAWMLGVIQFAVGQRVAAKNTLNGKDSKIIPIDNSKI